MCIYIGNNNNKRDEGMNDFVSAVCWSNVIIYFFLI